MKRLLGLLLLVGCSEPCHTGHYRTVHYEGSTSFVYMGKDMPMYPMYQGPYDAQEFVCDETEADFKLRMQRKLYRG